jgi:hypothetical protein
LPYRCCSKLPARPAVYLNDYMNLVDLSNLLKVYKLFLEINGIPIDIIANRRDLWHNILLTPLKDLIGTIFFVVFVRTNDDTSAKNMSLVTDTCFDLVDAALVAIYNPICKGTKALILLNNIVKPLFAP